MLHTEKKYTDRGNDGALMAGGRERKGGWTNEVTEYNAWSWYTYSKRMGKLKLTN
jgi:hypothetical protein